MKLSYREVDDKLVRWGRPTKRYQITVGTTSWEVSVSWCRKRNLRCHVASPARISICLGLSRFSALRNLDRGKISCSAGDSTFVVRVSDTYRSGPECRDIFQNLQFFPVYHWEHVSENTFFFINIYITRQIQNNFIRDWVEPHELGNQESIIIRI